MIDSGRLARPAGPPRTRAAAPRLVQLLLGLFGFGLAIALFIRSHIGLGPWDAFHFGIHVQTGMTVGTASIVAGLAIVGITVLMGVRPGVATVLNMVLIGVFTDLIMARVPDAASPIIGSLYFAAAVPLLGLSSGLYIGAGFGHGPRDALMVALVQRTGASVRRVRTVIELTVLVVGWAMGGVVGIGTVIIALTAGHAVQWGMRVFGALPAASPRAARRAEPADPPSTAPDPPTSTVPATPAPLPRRRRRRRAARP